VKQNFTPFQNEGDLHCIVNALVL